MPQVPAFPLADADRHAVRDRLEQSEDQGATVDAFLADLAAWLDADQADAARRQSVLAYAGERARRSRVLRPASPATPEQRAAESLRALGRRLAAHPALAAVRDTWPAPIAHELLRLADDLTDRPGPDGTLLPPGPEPALVQLRDAGEALVKVSAAVLLQALIAAGGEAGRWARAEVFQPNGTGQWVGLLRESARRVRTDLPDGPIRAFAALVERHLCPFADGLVQFRNQVIGHGLRTLDPEDTVRQVAGFIEEGRFMDGEGRWRTIPSLLKTLADLTVAGAFAGWGLCARDGVETIALVGAAATRDWLADPRHEETRHQDRTLPLALDLPDGSTLDLSPLLAARICSRCGRRDLLVFDSLHSTAPVGRFDLLDYARGHRSRLRGDESPDLGHAIRGLAIRTADLTDTSLDQADVLALLDRARVDRNYRSPEWLRSDLAAFLAGRAGGVWWLQAPAHCGKTTFVQGLAEPGLERADRPIDPRLGPLKPDNPDNRPVVAFYLRKEHRPGIGGLLAGLRERLETAFNLSSNAKQEAPVLTRAAAESLDPAGFLAWLDAYRRLGYRVANRGEPGPLLVCIDGLDEVERPDAEGRWPLQILPRDEEVPAGIYLVLTSRPVEDAEVPGYLRERLMRLYPGEPVGVGSAASG